MGVYKVFIYCSILLVIIVNLLVVTNLYIKLYDRCAYKGKNIVNIGFGTIWFQVSAGGLGTGSLTCKDDDICSNFLKVTVVENLHFWFQNIYFNCKEVKIISFKGW